MMMTITMMMMMNVVCSGVHVRSSAKLPFARNIICTFNSTAITVIITSLLHWTAQEQLKKITDLVFFKNPEDNSLCGSSGVAWTAFVKLPKCPIDKVKKLKMCSTTMSWRSQWCSWWFWCSLKKKKTNYSIIQSILCWSLILIIINWSKCQTLFERPTNATNNNCKCRRVTVIAVLGISTLVTHHHHHHDNHHLHHHHRQQ